MAIKEMFFRYILTPIFLLLSGVTTSAAATDQYDLVYIWDTHLESVLDYKDQLDEVFDDTISTRLKIVGRGDEYGVVYDTNGTARTIAQEIAAQGEVLRKAGLQEAWAIKDEGYHLLYNVSYGLGPNLESLRKTYDMLYAYLGKDVGKNLFIEKTKGDNYALIFRKRGDRASTMDVAMAHAKLLAKKHIKTSITPENNNEVVYGESSLLDDSGDSALADDGQGGQEGVAQVETAGPEDGPAEVDAVAKNESEPPSGQLVVIACDRNKKVLVPRSKQAVRDSAAAGKRAKIANSNTAFEKNIEQYIKGLRRSGKIRSDEKTGWMVYDLENDLNLVNINANQVFQAASMIKPFVALAFFHQVKKGKIHYGGKSRQMVEAMIQRSSNSATNWVMRQVGGPRACEKILQAHYRSIFKKTYIREYIPANGRTYKNSAPPSDYIRFLRALWNKELPYYKEMRRIMALPGRDRLYYGTPIPQGTLVYNKTGSTAHLIGDMGILAPKTKKGSRHPYAIVGIIERSSRATNYGNWMMARGDVIRQVSTLVYQEMKKQYQLR
ncbi:MAG: serine hydrolase [Desulfopila sp.]